MSTAPRRRASSARAVQHAAVSQRGPSTTGRSGVAATMGASPGSGVAVWGLAGQPATSGTPSTSVHRALARTRTDTRADID
ncbi:MAG: hypothetical protein R3A51_16500 [Nannocystaceae bacterium]